MLTANTLAKTRGVGEGLMGKRYDARLEWSDEAIYCTELVYKIYQRGAGIEIGELQKLSDFNLGHLWVAQKIRERLGAKIPMTQRVLSPRSMLEDPDLVVVFSR